MQFFCDCEGIFLPRKGINWSPMKWIGMYLLVINLVTMAIFLADKRRAGSKRRRVSERVLLLLALFGGSVGALAAM